MAMADTPTRHPADILEEASGITRFLAEIAVHLHEGGSDLGLSEKGAYGLFCILNNLDATINQAIELT